MKICVPLSSTERRCLCQSGEMEYGDNNGQCSSCELCWMERGREGRKEGGKEGGRAGDGRRE